jgi:hypothetical protein
MGRAWEDCFPVEGGWIPSCVPGIVALELNPMFVPIYICVFFLEGNLFEGLGYRSGLPLDQLRLIPSRRNLHPELLFACKECKVSPNPATGMCVLLLSSHPLGAWAPKVPNPPHSLVLWLGGCKWDGMDRFLRSQGPKMVL